MPAVDLVVETKVSRSPRARQVEALFDVPPQEKAQLSWKGEADFDAEPWNIGLIVGPSGSGKTSVARHLFEDDFEPALDWGAPSVLDDIGGDIGVADIADAFSAVGFGTIPAWLRPYSVLSNGERFRADIARRMLELRDPIVVDEFTSVVDRQVAKASCHAVQKYIRKRDRQLVAVSCHYDIIDWLQPDWILEPATMLLRRRHLQRRPAIDVRIQRVQHRTWRLFAPFHYLTADLNKAAACFCLFVNDEPVSFAGVVHFPHAKVKNIKRLSRLVTLPDWQGLGFAFVLHDALAAMYKAVGFRFRTYPAHPKLVRSFDRSKVWRMTKRPGRYAPLRGETSSTPDLVKVRPCATFEWVGPAHADRDEAKRIVEGSTAAGAVR